MKRFFFACVLFWASVNLGAGILTTDVNEFTGAVTYSYFTTATNDSRESFRARCEPEPYGVSIAFCRRLYEYLPDVRCDLSFYYRLDGGPVQRFEWEPYDPERSEGVSAFLKQVLNSNSLIQSIDSQGLGFTPIFDVSDFRDKAIQFSDFCKMELGVVDQVEVQPYENEVQEVFVAYYGRPADPSGLEYWRGRLSSANGNLSEIIESFANSPESAGLYGALSDSEKITAIYQQLFNRNPDSVGLAFYTGKLSSGELSHASIMLDVLNGAGGQDALIISNKINAATRFSQGLDTSFERNQYNDASIASVRNWLSSINENSNLAEITVDISHIISEF